MNHNKTTNPRGGENGSRGGSGVLFLCAAAAVIFVAALACLMISPADCCDAAPPAPGDEFEREGIKYSVTAVDGLNVSVEVVAKTPKYHGALTIPGPWVKAIDGNTYTYAVTGIGADAFRDCTGLVSVSVPTTVVVIGNHAFQGCTGLTCGLPIPDSVLTIGHYAFHGCFRLTGGLNLPKNLIQMGDYAFQGCTGLTGELKIPVFVGTVGVGAFRDCSGLSGTLAIPGSVETIGCSAFSGCTGFTAVTIPVSVKTIDMKTFEGCTGLSGTLVIPGSVETIDYNAFYGCTGLTGITVPGSVGTIAYSAFSDCTSLSRIDVVPAGPHYKSEEGVLFSGDGKTLVRFPEGKAADAYVIPGSVDTIGDGAFQGCTGLTGITIPGTVATIGYYAFRGCTGLSGALVIPGSVDTIGSCAFQGCTGLTGITIPGFMNNFNTNAFDGCTSLSGINVFPAGPDFRSEEGVLFSWNGKKLLRFPEGKAAYGYAIPDGVETVAQWAFYGCTKLTGTLTVPESVRTVDFMGLTGVTGITFLGHMNNMSSYMFGDCTSLSRIDVFPAGADYKSVDGVLFSGDGKELLCFPQGKVADAYVIPGSVETIGAGAFRGCAGLSGALVIPGSVGTIYINAFYGCTGLVGITIPGSVEAIGDGAFHGCTSLSRIDVVPAGPHYKSEEGVLFSGDGKTLVRFPEGKAADAYVIPGSVDTIGNGAFQGCTGLTGITIPGTVATIGYYAFRGCTKLTGTPRIPESVTSIGLCAFHGCTGLVGVAIPGTVETIGPIAFMDCGNVRLIVLEGGIPDSAWHDGYSQFRLNDGLPMVKCPVVCPAGQEMPATVCGYKFWPGTALYYYGTVNAAASVEGAGTFAGTGLHRVGTDVTVKATPNPGYRFVGWSDGVAEAERTFTVYEEAYDLVATFVEDGGGPPPAPGGDGDALPYVGVAIAVVVVVAIIALFVYPGILRKR